MCLKKSEESEKGKMGDKMKKNILVVDDSALMRRVICDIINSDSTFQATDVCKDGLEAYEKLKSKSYDGVILDVNMPRMGGLQLLERLQKENIMANVIMVSTLTKNDADVTILAMERGAIDFVTKPTNIVEAKGEDFKEKLLNVLNAVIATRGHAKTVHSAGTTQKAGHLLKISVAKEEIPPKRLSTSNAKSKLIAIACSTGGPKALQDVIPYIPENIDAPIVLVQHMPVGFTKSMAERLDAASQTSVKEAVEGDVLKKGYVYIAPGGKHMEVRKKSGGEHVIALNDMPPIGGLKPCANIMFDSLSKTGFDKIICVVLTGMGADGTQGIISLSKYKPIHVIAQDAKTCVVYGMPKMIADAGMVDEVVPLKEVAKTIIKNVGVK